jgi:hypothetical protein
MLDLVREDCAEKENNKKIKLAMQCFGVTSSIELVVLLVLSFQVNS